MNSKKIELLAPAGNAAAALAAFDAGADAVYAGMAKFNARERSENFSEKMLAGIVEYAHGIGRKVYITFNTIIKEDELAQAVDYLSILNSIRPDALIIQDLGILNIIREYFPKLKVHASTQMGFHNSAGLKLAGELGFSRVIMERQVTFGELRAIVPQSPVDLEIFVHGALCCSMSGQCLFSSWHGGASGNRGKCKQPCRRRFYGSNGNGFFFSTQDLCLIDSLREIRELGVVSLKIEGRLRQPDYVKNAVSAYRMMLDTPSDSPDYMKRLGEARSMLAQTYGRKWSQGFYTAESLKSLISHESLGASGLLCGKICENRDHGFAFVANKKIHIGDRIRVQPKSGDEGNAFTVTKMFVNDRSVMKGKAGERVFICCDKKMPFDGLVFKIGESVSDYSGRIKSLPEPRVKIDMKIAISRKNLTVEVINASLPPWHYEWSLEPAQKHAADSNILVEMFRAADSSVFAAGAISCQIDGEYFIPAGILKTARRDFWNYLKSNLDVDEIYSGSESGVHRFKSDYQKMSPAPIEPTAQHKTIAVTQNNANTVDHNAIYAADIFNMTKIATEAILPEFCAEGQLEKLANAIKQAYSRGIRRFRVSALFGLELLKNYQDIVVTAGGALPLCNSFGAIELQRFRVAKILGHCELESTALKALAAHSPLPVELYRFGAPLLLITRAAIQVEGVFRDARGQEFIAKYDKTTQLTRVYPVKTVALPHLPGLLDFYDFRNSAPDNKTVSEFNFNSCLQ